MRYYAGRIFNCGCEGSCVLNKYFIQPHRVLFYWSIKNELYSLLFYEMCVECVSNTRMTMTENENIMKIHIAYTKATNGHFCCNLILIIVVYWRCKKKLET